MRRAAILTLATALAPATCVPFAWAQHAGELQSDHDAIQNKQDQIRHDQKELNHDVRKGDYHDARREQREINGREQQLQQEHQQLNEDRWQRDHATAGTIVMHGTITITMTHDDD